MADVLDYFGSEPLSGLPWDQTRQAGAGILDYLRNVVTGRVAAGGPAGQASYDPNKSFRENVLDPAAHEAAMSMVGPGAIRAYHASPFDFAQFSLNNLRGGTGGLAQGRGLYFAQKEPVSLDYKRQFQERGTFEGPDPNGPYMDAYNAAHRVIAPPGGLSQETLQGVSGRATDIASSVAEGVRRGDDLAHYRNFVRQSDWEPEKKAMWIAAIDAAMPYKFKPGPAHMYEVDIHADPNRLLNYDVPLNAQTPEVMRSLEQIPWAQDYLKSGQITGAGVVPKTVEGVQQFSEAGIPGIKYLDQFSRNLPHPSQIPALQRRAAELEQLIGGKPYDQPLAFHELERIKGLLAQQPTHNYVISDPQRTRIDILRKYGILPPLAVGAAAAGSEP